MKISSKEEKICLICSNVLSPGRKKYCCRECALKAAADQRKSYVTKYNNNNFTKVYSSKAKAKKKSKKLDRNSLEYINELARSEGLSYGQYVGKHGL